MPDIHQGCNEHTERMENIHLCVYVCVLVSSQILLLGFIEKLKTRIEMRQHHAFFCDKRKKKRESREKKTQQESWMS